MEHNLRIWMYSFLVRGVLLSGCVDEPVKLIQGDVNEAIITEISPVYQVEPHGMLDIVPEISFTLDSVADAARYRYEWFQLRVVGFVSPGEDYKIVGATKELHIQVPFIQGAYDFMLRVTDLQTNLFTEKEFRVFVANSLYEGWVVLGDKRGEATLDMLSYQLDKEVYEHISSPQSMYYPNTTVTGRPLFIDFAMGSFFWHFAGGIVVGTTAQVGAYDTDYFLFRGDFYEYLPIGGAVDFNRVAYAGRMQSVFLNVDGSLFLDGNMAQNIYPSFRKIDKAMNSNGALRTIEPGPWLAVSKGFSVQQVAVIFDERAKEFLWFQALNTYANDFYPGSLFHYKTGKDVLYLGYTERDGGQYVALLQEPESNEVYLARFSLNDQLYYEKIDAPLVGGAGHFAVHPTEGVLFYSVANQLFAIDEEAKEARLLETFAEGSISKIKFNSFLKTIQSSLSYTGTTASAERYQALQEQLIVCTYDPHQPDDSGLFRLFDVDTKQWTLEERYRHGGFPKIVDVVYKER